MQEKFVYQCDNRVFHGKPTAEESAGINARLAKNAQRKEATLEQFIRDSLRYSVAPFETAPAIATGSRETKWQAQQLFFLDIDNKEDACVHKKVTLEMFLQACEQAQVRPAAVLASASHNNHNPRFHALWVADKPLTDKKRASQFLMSIAKQLGSAVSHAIDPASFRPTQFYYAAKEKLYCDPSARVDVSSLLSTVAAESLEGQFDSLERIEPNESNQVVSWIANKDLTALRSWLTAQAVLPLWQDSKTDNNAEMSCGNWVSWIPVKMGKLLHHSLFFPQGNNLPTLTQGAGNTLPVGDQGLLYLLYSAVPLEDFFGIERQHCCLFHEDHKPSASIACSQQQDKRLGKMPKYRYYCHSQECSISFRSPTGGLVGLDLIDLISMIQSCSQLEAIAFLNDLFGIRLYSRLWRREKKQSLQWMIEKLHNDQFATSYPNLMKILRPHLDKLEAILCYVHEHMPPISLTGDDQLVFSLALSTLQKYMKEKMICGVNTADRLNSRMLLLCELGLLGRSQEAEIPESKMLSACAESKKKSGVKISRHTSFYVIPTYCEKLLAEAEQRARKFFEKRVSRKYMRREVVLRRAGAEKMIELFPQRLDLPVDNQESARIYNAIKTKAELLLSYAGFFTKSTLLNAVKGYSTQQKIAAYEKYISVISEELGLVWTKVNKAFRSRWNCKNVTSNCVAWVYSSETEQERTLRSSCCRL